MFLRVSCNEESVIVECVAFWMRCDKGPFTNNVITISAISDPCPLWTMSAIIPSWIWMVRKIKKIKNIFKNVLVQYLKCFCIVHEPFSHSGPIKQTNHELRFKIEAIPDAAGKCVKPTRVSDIEIESTNFPHTLGNADSLWRSCPKSQWCLTSVSPFLVLENQLLSIFQRDFDLMNHSKIT